MKSNFKTTKLSSSFLPQANRHKNEKKKKNLQLATAMAVSYTIRLEPVLKAFVFYT